MSSKNTNESIDLNPELTDAIANLYNIGSACIQCGWDSNKVLWCTSTHSIKVKHLVALGVLIKK